MANLAQEMNKLSKERKAKKVTKKKGRKFVNLLPLNKLLKPKTIKKLEKEELEAQLNGNMGKIIKELQKFYQQKGTKIIEDFEELADIFLSKKFAKALKSVCKDKEQAPQEILFVISDLQDKGVFKGEEKLQEIYLRIFSDSMEDKVKKVAKTLEIKKVDALLLLLHSQTYPRMPKRFFRDRTYKFLSIFYEASAQVDINAKQAAKLIKMIFGKDMESFVVQALLEKRSNYNNLEDGEKGSWDVITEVVLTYLDKIDKDDRKDLLKVYAKQRANNVNVKRRVNLIEESSEYKNIKKTIERLINLSMDKALFM